MQAECGICKDRKSSYTCPRCSILYCSLKCYRAAEHIKCSEGFYKECVEEEMKDGNQQRISKQRMQEILERVYDNNEDLDSDDCSDTEDLSARLCGVDLDSPEKIWAKLSAKERKEFENILKDAGKINKLIPDWQAWWLVQDVGDGVSENTPQVSQEIPVLSTIMKKKPSEAVAFGLGNILFGYTVVARLFFQDWALNAKEAVKTLLAITHDMNKYHTWASTIEALNDAGQVACKLKILSTEQCELARSDAEEIMKSKMFTLAAISDLNHLFKIAFKTEPSLKKEHFPLLKKLEFYLSFINEFGGSVELPSNVK